MSIETESTEETQPAGDVEQTEDISLADQLAQAFDSQVEIEDATEVEKTGVARERNADGTFKEKSEVVEESAAPDAADKTAGKKPEAELPGAKPEGTEAEKAAAAPAAQLQDPTQAPAHWSAADKARHAALAKSSPADAQWLLDRHKAMEADYTQKTQGVARLRNEYEPIDRMFAPHADRLKAGGYSPQTLIRAWASVENELMSGDEARQIGVLQKMVQNYKMSPERIAKALGITGGGAAAAPVGDVAQLIAQKPWMQDLAGVNDFIARTQQQSELTQQQAEQAAANEHQRLVGELTAEIDKFRTAADGKGQLLHPHFADVEADMANHAQLARASGKKLTLMQLYEAAVYSNPVTRAKALAADSTAQRSQAEVDARSRAAKARKAGSSVTGAPGPGQTPSARQIPKDATLAQQLSAAYDASLSDQ